MKHSYMDDEDGGDWAVGKPDDPRTDDPTYDTAEQAIEAARKCDGKCHKFTRGKVLAVCNLTSGEAVALIFDGDVYKK